MNRISHPDWVKLCVYPNGRIRLCTKQKYEIFLLQKGLKNIWLWITLTHIFHLVKMPIFDKLGGFDYFTKFISVPYDTFFGKII